MRFKEAQSPDRSADANLQGSVMQVMLATLSRRRVFRMLKSEVLSSATISWPDERLLGSVACEVESECGLSWYLS